MESQLLGLNLGLAGNSLTIVSVTYSIKAVTTCVVVLLQYMVLYQLLMALMFNTSFYMDGSRPNNQQVRLCLCLVPEGNRQELL